MSQLDYRSIAEQDAYRFAQFICDEEINLNYAQFLVFIENDGTIDPHSPHGRWDEAVEFPTDLLQHLRKAGLTGQVLLSAWPEPQGGRFGIEIQVEESSFYPLPPNAVQPSYSTTGYIDANGQLVRIPRDPHPGRYYFPNLITVSSGNL